MPHPIPPHETRTLEQLRQQWDVERELAQRLREATDTRGLYGAVYEEFFRRVPHLPAVAQRGDGEERSELVSLQLSLLAPFLAPTTRFLEVGGGDCALAIELSRRVRQVTAIEASATVVQGAPCDRGNLVFLLCDAPPYPLASASVDLAFSCHFIEHLRPDDALLHLREMRRLLDGGGRYVCVTPHRVWGPHDVSRYFSDVPQGLHLREYSCGALLDLLAQAGFRRRRVIAGVGATDTWLPHAGFRTLEWFLGLTPVAARQRALQVLSGSRQPPLRLLEQVIVSASR